ncbi:MAG: EamA family transporter [Gemmatimonadota bacterium]|nr:MAG: EamA family transporter [Gemmatimonadota bacterium]
MIAQATGAILALAAALAWGAADFTGGLASRRSNPLEVLALSRLSIVVVLAAAAAVTRDPLPTLTATAWAGGAGLSGALGIAALYQGLATERSALVVPTAGVVGAAIPVLFGAIVEGMLPLVQQAGLGIALAGIWLVSGAHRANRAEGRGLLLGALAGIGFGGFFILLGQIESGAVFTPLVVAGGAGLVAASLALAQTRTAVPVPTRNPAALWAGVMDATGVVCYALAVRWIRLDVAAVLGSLYPAITVLLFRAVLEERVAKTQWLGLAICVVAIALIVV